MKRALRATVAGLIALCVSTPSGPVTAEQPVGNMLGSLWTTVLELPESDNPFTSDDHCVEFGDGAGGRAVVAPFAPFGVTTVTCVVRPGTRLFVTVYSSECSTLEGAPYFGRDESELRACARAADAGVTVRELTVDGDSVQVREAESGLLDFELTEGNIFGLPPGTEGLSVAHGWVASLQPLTPGTHTIVLHSEGVDAFGNAFDLTNTTTIIVAAGRKSS